MTNTNGLDEKPLKEDDSYIWVYFKRFPSNLFNIKLMLFLFLNVDSITFSIHIPNVLSKDSFL